MNRDKRRRFLERIELLAKGKSKSKTACILSNNFEYYRVQRIRNQVKYIHLSDYRNQYPVAIDILNRICYPKKNDRWGRRVEQKQNLIKDLCLRDNELIKRFRNLIKDCKEDETKILNLLGEILDNNPSKELKHNLKSSIKPEDTKYYKTIILFLSI